MQFDIAIIGGGIVGAATFAKIQKRNPSLKLALFERGFTSSSSNWT